MKIIALILSLGLFGCSSGGGDSAASVDPISGEWYYETPGSTPTSARGIIAKIGDGKVFFAYVYAESDGNSLVFYHRKTEGTYTKSGDKYTLNYSYETCNPIGSEQLEIKVIGEKLNVYSPTEKVGFTMSRPVSGAQVQSMMAIEDKNCNILSKIEKSDKRNVASAKGKSIISEAR